MAEGQDVLTDLLLERLFAARAKHKVQDLLRTLKMDGGHSRSAFRVSGGVDDIASTVRGLVDTGVLPLATLADLVDSVEENGGQHIFLFTLTSAGQAAVTEARARSSFPQAPQQPTSAFYSKLPTAARTYYVRRSPTLVVKEVRTAERWVLDSDAGQETADRRTIVFRKERRRAVNLFIADPATSQVEVRIARAADHDDVTLARTLFTEFRARIEPLVDFQKHLAPLAIWNGFTKIVRATDETFMSHDEAEDPSVVHKLSNRRAKMRGRDVREHDSYDMDAIRYKRTSLNVFWNLPNGSVPTSHLHTVLSRFRFDVPPPPLDCGKVYVAATVDPKDLSYVLDRIRYFAA
jgi:hypothetical protein